MLLMHIQAAIPEYMGVNVSTRALYRASSLAAMAETVWESRETATEDPEGINWAKEAAAPDWLKQRVNETLEAPIDPKTRTGGLEVVLTGATGSLGGCILHTRVQSPAVQRVHCIAIEADDTNHLPKESNGKVRAYTGSLSDRKLGLTANEHALLEQTADVIIHAGSNGHCRNNYPALQAPNVAATHQLAAMALTRAVPLLFVSSNRVSLLAGKAEQPPMSMADYAPPVDGREGLSGKKWAGEVFLENLNNYYH